MGNEKYVNYYIESLTTSISDVVIRNISMQAVARINEELIAELSKKNEELVATQDELRKSITDLRDSFSTNENQTITSLQADITAKEETIRNLSAMCNDFEAYKSQANHVDTFRAELLNARKEIEDNRTEYEKQISDLKKTIDYLKLTPAQRKKIDSLNKGVSEDVTKDGGSF